MPLSAKMKRKRKILPNDWIFARRSGLAATALALTLCVIGSACRRGEKTDEQDQDAAGLHHTFDRGPLSVTIDIDQREITIADQVHLDIEIIAQENYEVEFPRFGDKLEQFGIVDYHTEPLRLVGEGKTRRDRTYTLEPFLSGTYSIPPMTFRFWEKDDPDNTHELETEVFSLEVTSLLPEQMAELKIHEITPPFDLPRSRKGWVLAGSALGVAGVLAAGAWILFRARSRSENAVHQVPAHEIAYRELESLIAEELPQRGEYKLFYQRISAILRHYIENRFGLHAPEETTEEFLVSLSNTNTLGPQHKSLLNEFLKYCDLVKFAEHQPETSDMQNTFDACKRFIFDTEEDAEVA